MNWQDQIEHDRAFLREQLSHLEHKLTRLENARAACQNCLEAEGLDRLLHAARLEETILTTLEKSQSGEDATPLDGLIVTETEHYKAVARRQAANWRRGQPTPSAYWDAEASQGILTDVLRRLHAWRAGRPYYAETGGGIHAGPNGTAKPAPKPAYGGGSDIHPWYLSQPTVPPEETPVQDASYENGSALDAFRARLYTALHNAHFPDEHVELVVQPDGLVIATGYAHDDEQAEIAVEVMTEFPGVWRVLADIKVIDEAHCPACRALAENRSHVKRERWHGAGRDTGAE
jgi:hypothetical protein